jgi:D-alanine-D-alanine ligase
MASRSRSERSRAFGLGSDVPRPARVAVLVDEVAENESAAAVDLAPAQSTASVVEALTALGHEPLELSLQPGRTGEWLARLIDGDFDFAFNLCETVAGRAEGEHLAAAAVELLGLPMTGASSATLLLCLHKDRCAAVLRAHGIPVPDWAVIDRGEPAPDRWDRFPAIVKPAADDASNGVHPSSVVRSPAELREAVERLRAAWRKLVVQEFIEGREINLAIVGSHSLPPAEIDFSRLPEGSPPIVSFDAKWKPGSPEDLGTRPVCPAPLPDRRVEELQRLGQRVWHLVDGWGYARIDVRLTPDGVPYVIDINPNPDLSPDAGLARQAQAAGWSYTTLIERIVEAALGGRGEGEPVGDGVRNRPAAAPEPATGGTI